MLKVKKKAKTIVKLHSWCKYCSSVEVEMADGSKQWQASIASFAHLPAGKHLACKDKCGEQEVDKVPEVKVIKAEDDW